MIIEQIRFHNNYNQLETKSNHNPAILNSMQFSEYLTEDSHMSDASR